MSEVAAGAATEDQPGARRRRRRAGSTPGCACCHGTGRTQRTPAPPSEHRPGCGRCSRCRRSIRRLGGEATRRQTMIQHRTLRYTFPARRPGFQEKAPVPVGNPGTGVAFFSARRMRSRSASRWLVDPPSRDAADPDALRISPAAASAKPMLARCRAPRRPRRHSAGCSGQTTVGAALAASTRRSGAHIAAALSLLFLPPETSGLANS